MQETENRIGLVWFRNDLRVQDNTVLKSAIENHKKVIALYCFDPRHYEVGPFGFKKTEKYRAQFLIETVTDLKANLSNYNIELFIYHEHPEVSIPKLVHQFNIEAVYFQEEWTKEEKDVEIRLKDALSSDIKLQSYYDQFLFHPDDINMPIENIPQVFTNFRKKVEKYSEVRPCVSIDSKPEPIELENNTKIPSLSDLGLEEFEQHTHTAVPFSGGEHAALSRLEDYTFKSKKLGVYKKTRNGLIGKDFSSKFSIWLANGSISSRTIYWTIKKFEDQHFSNQSTYWLIFELIWRDYFKFISLKHGNSHLQN